MKPTAFIINTSRGPVIDEAALTRALRTKKHRRRRARRLRARAQRDAGSCRDGERRADAASRQRGVRTARGHGACRGRQHDRGDRGPSPTQLPQPRSVLGLTRHRMSRGHVRRSVVRFAARINNAPREFPCSAGFNVAGGPDDTPDFIRLRRHCACARAADRSGSRSGQFSVQADQARGAAGRGRWHRLHGARCCAAAVRNHRPAGDRGECGWRRWNDRRRLGGAFGARRLHAALSFGNRCGHRRDCQGPALRLVARPRAGVAGHPLCTRHGDQPVAARPRPQGVHRAGQRPIRASSATARPGPVRRSTSPPNCSRSPPASS